MRPGHEHIVGQVAAAQERPKGAGGQVRIAVPEVEPGPVVDTERRDIAVLERF